MFGMQAIMTDSSSESEMRPVEEITVYKWSLHSWSLLYSQYNNIKSPKFKINGVDGCTCQIKLVIFTVSHYRTSFVEIEFSDTTHILLISAETSLLDSRGSILWTETSHLEDHRTICQDFPVKLERTGNYEYLRNDTLIVHVLLTVVKSISISTSLKDVYSVNFEEIIRENLEALKTFHERREVTLFIGGKKLFVLKIIFADKTELFKSILMGVVKETGESGTYLSDTKVKMFEDFFEYLNDGTMDSWVLPIDKIIDVNKYTLDERKNSVKKWITDQLSDKKKKHVTPDNILEYVLITYDLLCRAFRKQARNFIELNKLNLSIPENNELFSKYLSLVKNFDE